MTSYLYTRQVSNSTAKKILQNRFGRRFVSQQHESFSENLLHVTRPHNPLLSSPRYEAGAVGERHLHGKALTAAATHAKRFVGIPAAGLHGHRLHVAEAVEVVLRLIRRVPLLALVAEAKVVVFGGRRIGVGLDLMQERTKVTGEMLHLVSRVSER